MTDKTLTTAEMGILRSLIGRELESFEGCPLGPGDYYGAIRLNVHESPVDISNFFEKADVSFEEGTGVEDVGTMRVSRAAGILKFGDLASEAKTSLIAIRSEIRGIEVVTDTIEMIHKNIVTNEFAFTQAIIMHLATGSLVVDRNIWFEVFLSACVTADARRFIRDTEKDWNTSGSKYRAIVKRECTPL